MGSNKELPSGTPAAPDAQGRIKTREAGPQEEPPENLKLLQLGDEIADDLANPYDLTESPYEDATDESTDQPTGRPTDNPILLDFEIPGDLPVKAAERDNYSFTEWQHVPDHPWKGDSYYPIAEIDHVGRVRLTGGFMEPKGHGRKAGIYTVIMPDGSISHVGPPQGEEFGRFNLGIDYVTLEAREPVKTWYGGRVVYVRHVKPDDNTYGNRVVIKTGLTYRLDGKDYPVYQAYGHLKKIDVEKGQTVRQGDTIGKMGRTGGTNQPHIDLRTFIIEEGTFRETLLEENQPRWTEVSLNALGRQLQEKTPATAAATAGTKAKTDT